VAHVPLNDFAMIPTVGFLGLAIVTDPASRVKCVQDLIKLAKAEPGKYNIASISVGSTQYLAAALFRSTAGIDMQLVPYKATPDMFICLKNQDIQTGFEIVRRSSPTSARATCARWRSRARSAIPG
jgi:tripartite-type tricarboxylate transporter receptor subunit TctC